MANKIIDVKAGRLFPAHFHILGAVFMFAALIVVVNHPVAGSILIFISVFIFTAYEGTEINPSSKTFREYYSFLFVKTGKTEKYNSAEGVFIHKARISQKMFTARTLSSSTFSHLEYHAYLKLQGREKIFLMSDRNKAKLLERARTIASALNIAVSDYAVSP